MKVLQHWAILRFTYLATRKLCDLPTFCILNYFNLIWRFSVRQNFMIFLAMLFNMPQTTLVTLSKKKKKKENSGTHMSTYNKSSNNIHKCMFMWVIGSQSIDLKIYSFLTDIMRSLNFHILLICLRDLLFPRFNFAYLFKSRISWM